MDQEFSEDMIQTEKKETAHYPSSFSSTFLTTLYENRKTHDELLKRMIDL